LPHIKTVVCVAEERAVLEALVRSNPELLEVINEIAYERQTVILVALGDNEEARDYYMAEKSR